MYSRIPATSGIYRITCTVTGKFYIGSAINLRNRWNDHLKYLRRNEHANQKLQRAWNKYGEQAFIHEIVELVLFPDLLTAREQYWLDKLKPFGKKGFNIARIAGSSMGRKYSQASIEKMRSSHRGKPSPNRGKKYSLEKCEQRRQAAASQRKTLILTSPEGIEYTVTGIGHFCKEHGLLRHHIMRVARGEYKHHKGWRARFPGTPASKEPLIGYPRKVLTAVSPEGIEYRVTRIRPFCREHGLSATNIIHVAQGKYKQHKGWTAHYVEDEASQCQIIQL